MRLHGINQPIKEILEKSFYKIPRFQRPYSWDEEQVTDLWNDLVANYSNDYFIGSLVVYSIDNYSRGVVDGQQRLMTLTIMLAALRDFLESLKQNDLAMGIQNFIERKNVKNQSTFIVQHEASYPFFQKRIQTFPTLTAKSSSTEESKIHTAYEFISTKITEMTHGKSKKKQITLLEQTREKILTVQAILINLDTEDDAYLVFEILNSRGKNLCLADLVKNHILRMIPSRNAMLDTAKDDWTKIQNNINHIDDMDIDTFLRHYYNSIQGSTPEHALYKKYKEMITKKNVNQEIQNLVDESERYLKISSPHSVAWTKAEHDISKPLIALKTFGVTVSAPLMLSALRKHSESIISRKQLLKILGMLEQFHFEYSAICSKRSSGGLASLFGSIAKKLTASNTNAEVDAVIRDLSIRLNPIKPTKLEFINEFKKLEYSNTNTKYGRLLRYIFSRIEADRMRGVVIDWDKMSIEHFLAQNAKLPIMTTQQQTYNVGNLLLLNPKYNSDLGSLAPADKVKEFKKDKFPFDPFLKANCKTWDGEKIQKRATALAESVWAPSL